MGEVREKVKQSDSNDQKARMMVWDSVKQLLPDGAEPQHEHTDVNQSWDSLVVGVSDIVQKNLAYCSGLQHRVRPRTNYLPVISTSLSLCVWGEGGKERSLGAH